MTGVSENHDNEFLSENHNSYTPTTEEVRNIFSWNNDEGEVDAKIGFDRWLFEMQEDAWDRGYQAGVVDFAAEGTNNPYRQAERLAAFEKATLEDYIKGEIE